MIRSSDAIRSPAVRAGMLMLAYWISGSAWGAVPSICGAPAVSGDTDAGLYLWQEDCASARPTYVVQALAGGSPTTLTYQGSVTTNDVFSSLTAISLEANDVLQTFDADRRISYSLNVRSPWRDAFTFSVAQGASTCVGLDLPAGADVLVGPEATPVAAPFDIETMGPCAAGSDSGMNVVVILTDDQRWNTMWSMPSINDLAKQGVRFSNAFVSDPLCSPTRATVLSGGFRATNTGIISNNQDISAITDFNDRDTLALRLQRAGYQTFFIGKYLNYYITLNGYVPPGWSRWLANTGANEPWDYFTVTEGSSGDLPSIGDKVGPITQYVTDYHRDEVLAFLDQVGDQPFFVFWSAFPPHAPATPAIEDVDLLQNYVYRGRSWGEADLSDKPSWVSDPTKKVAVKYYDDVFQRDQLLSARSLDRGVQAIVDKVTQLGKADNTVFLFLSDNGYLWGEHGLSEKGMAYEESVRVPLVAFGAGVQPGVKGQMVLADTDLAPTVMELAGLQSGPTDGVSFLPLLTGGNMSPRQSVLFESWGNGADGPYATWAALRTNRWKYIVQANGDEELYDLWTDPYEMESRHDDFSLVSVKADLSAQLEAEKSLAMKPPQWVPKGTVGRPYSLPLEGWGGSGSYVWRVETGTLPPGLSLNSVTGEISGTPTTPGSWDATIVVEDGTTGTHSGLPRRHKRLFGFNIQ